MARLLPLLVWPVYRSASPRWKRHVVAALMAASSVVVAAALFDLFGQAARADLRLDTHMRTSLHQALVLSFCGKYGVVGPQFNYNDAAGDAELVDGRNASPQVPYAQRIAAKYGSVERYCALSVNRVLNNENSLFLVMAALLALPPDDAPATLAIKLTAFACALLFAALHMLALLGTGIVPLMLIGLISCRAVELVQHTHPFSVYSIMPVLLLLGGAGVATLLRIAERGRMSAVVMAALGFGATAALIYNFRTSYGLAVAGQLLAALAMLALRRKTVARHGMLLAASVLGFVIFQAALIWPLERGSNFNEARHGIWHPLVMGVSIPLTPFSEREGIRWDDNVGYALAKRVDPAVSYLGPGYEAALQTYYFRLWRDHPSEMRRVYRLKMHELGVVLAGLVDAFFQAPRLTRWFSTVIPRGLTWFLCLLAISLVMVLAYPVCPPIAVAGIGFAAAVFCVSVEQVAITTVLVIIYQASLVVLTTALLAMLSVLAAAALASRRPQAEPPTVGAATAGEKQTA